MPSDSRVALRGPVQDNVPAKLVRAGDVAYEDLLRAVPTATADLFTPPVIARLDDHVPFILPSLGAGGEHCAYR